MLCTCKKKHAVYLLRRRADQEHPAHHERPANQSTWRATRSVVSQLRRHARGRPNRSGLAGRSLPHNCAFGLALHHADGNRHCAHGRPLSPPRGGLRPSAVGPLNQQRYWDKRERERERCISNADASTYGPVRPRGDSRHMCPARTHAKTAPSPKRYRSLSKKNPLLRCKVDHQGKTQTRSIYVPAPKGMPTRNHYIPKPQQKSTP